MPACPFCAPTAVEMIAEDASGLAFLDRFPVSPRHCLIVP